MLTTILDMLACNCTKKCALPRYVCMVNGLKCTDMCKLKNCDNQADDDDCYHTFPSYLGAYHFKNHHESYSPQMIPTDPSSSWTNSMSYSNGILLQNHW